MLTASRVSILCLSCVYPVSILCSHARHGRGGSNELYSALRVAGLEQEQEAEARKQHARHRHPAQAGKARRKTRISALVLRSLHPQPFTQPDFFRVSLSLLSLPCVSCSAIHVASCIAAALWCCRAVVLSCCGAVSAHSLASLASPC